MKEKEKKFVKEVNIDKAKKKVIPAIVLIIINLLTYILPLIFGRFDFGLIFEGASFIFLLISRFYMSLYDEVRAKKYIICSIASIGWILVYDFIKLCSYVSNGIDLAFLGYDYIFFELFLILYIITLFAINKDLSKADNPIKYRESTDWFYETCEEKENDK